MKAQTSPDPLYSLGFNWAQMRGEGPRAPQGQALQPCEGSQGRAGAGAVGLSRLSLQGCSCAHP